MTTPAVTSLFLVGVPKEVFPGERRVAATPATVQALKKLGVGVLVEAGAGDASNYSDAEYIEAGAQMAPGAARVWAESDLVLKVRPPMPLPDGKGHEADLLKQGASLVAFIWPAQNKAVVEKLAARRATVLAMDAVPRITRAQRMDALSAMANIAGYRAVIEAAQHFGSFLGGQITAAGKVPPARVLVIGAGVAGLAAVAAARSLGAIVVAFDTRPAVREQVESLGGQFLEFRFEESGEGEGGYAKEMSEAYLQAEQALIAKDAELSDIVITTALIPGKPAPQLITSGAVVAMKPGSVIVDLAAEQGGNCALTEPGKIVQKFGVTLVGLTDMPSRMPRKSSDLYAATILALVSDVFKQAGSWTLDLEDEVHRGALILQEGRMMWPPPSKPKPRAAAPPPVAQVAASLPRPQQAAGMTAAAWVLMGSVGLAFALAVLFGPPQLGEHLTVFLLACIVGWHVVWDVSPALHTPLMSVTNAISGIILVGGMVVLGRGATGGLAVLAAVAVLVAAINVAGGFLVTQRMLRMFRR